MNILVINCWSSTIKYKLFVSKNREVLAKGVIELKKEKKGIFILKDILKKYRIDAIWHRVVHGWEEINKPTRITQKTINTVKKYNNLAPLHNPANLKWIIDCEKIFPKIPQVWVFDTAFHQTMNEDHFLYPIPYNLYKKEKIRKYWFHWISHQYLYERMIKIMKKKTAKIITCHVGNGWSITAIDGWKVVETSMGFTPLEWIMMGTRCWDIDPAILIYLAKQKKRSIEKIDTMLNKESWLQWILNSEDMRDCRDRYIKGDKKASIAMNMYCNRIVKYVAYYNVLLKWADAIVVSAWILENAPIVRELLLNKLETLGINVDKKANSITGKEVCISDHKSKIPVWVIPTNEELMIAKETEKILKK